MKTSSLITVLASMPVQEWIDLRYQTPEVRYNVIQPLMRAFHANPDLDHMLEAEDGEFGGHYGVHLYTFRDSDNNMVSLTSPNESHDTWRVVLSDGDDNELEVHKFSLNDFDQIIATINNLTAG